MTVSRSGQICRPKSRMSSPVLPTTVTSASAPPEVVEQAAGEPSAADAAGEDRDAHAPILSPHSLRARRGGRTLGRVTADHVPSDREVARALRRAATRCRARRRRGDRAAARARSGPRARCSTSPPRVRDRGLEGAGRPGVITYSRKVFIPLTRLCRDRCHYCTFATDPASLRRGGHAMFLSPDEVLDIARAGCRARAARRRCSPWATAPRTAGRPRGSGSTRTATTTRSPTSARWRSASSRRPACCRT